MIFNINYDESKTKQNQREAILNAAYKMFIDKGIQNATMQDIAKASSIQRRTLYYYYENKEAVAIELIKCVISEYKKKAISFNAPNYLTTGYSKLEYLFHKLLEFLLENEEMALFTVHYDYYFNKEHYDKYIESSNYIEFQNENYSFLSAIKLGIEDGSIKKQYENNTEEILFISLSSLMALVNRILFREDIIRRESGYDRKNISVLIDIILNGLKA